MRPWKPNPPRLLKEIEEEYVRLDEETGCYLWEGAKGGDGYGIITQNNVTRRVHRVFYENYVGPIPEGMFVCHACDVKNCVNPLHLCLGTNRENMDDMVEKGRAATGDRNGSRLYPEKLNAPRGDRHGSRLHPEKVARGNNHWTRRDPEKWKNILRNRKFKKNEN
jgi:hypothetical protein